MVSFPHEKYGFVFTDYVPTDYTKGGELSIERQSMTHYLGKLTCQSIGGVRGISREKCVIQ